MSEPETTNAIQPAPHAKLGRPTIYTPELAQTLLDRYAAGEAIHDICACEGMPDHRTYRRWKRELPDFASALAQARADKAELLADGGLALLDEPLDLSLDGKVASAGVQRANSRANYRMKLAGCLDRDTYGERPSVQVNIANVGVAFARLSSPVATDDE